MKDLAACNQLLRRYIKKAKWQESIALMQQMEADQIRPDVVTINSVLSACERSAEWQCVLHFFAQQRRGWRSLMRTAPVDKFTLSIVMKAFSRGQRWLEAIHHLSKEGLSVDLVVWNAAMAACEKASAWRWCLHLLHSCPFPPDLVTFNTLLSALGRARQWQKCLQQLRQMPRKDILSYNSGISACSGYPWPSALQLLSDAQVAKVKLTIITYNSAIAACDKGHQWQKALQLFSELQASRGRATEVTYSSVLSACEVSLPWSSLLQLLSSGHRLDDGWVALAVACGKSKHWEMALTLLEALGDAAAPSLWPATVKACAAAMRWQAAWQLLQDGWRHKTSDVCQLPLEASARAGVGHQASWSRCVQEIREEYLEVLRHCQLDATAEMEANPTAEVVRLALTSLNLQNPAASR